MRKNIIIALLALIVAVESIVMFVDNEQQSLKAETNMSSKCRKPRVTNFKARPIRG